MVNHHAALQRRREQEQQQRQRILEQQQRQRDLQQDLPSPGSIRHPVSIHCSIISVSVRYFPCIACDVIDRDLEGCKTRVSRRWTMDCKMLGDYECFIGYNDDEVV